MILFALPNAVIPGISFILGAPVVLFALQLAAGRQEVWLPAFMRRQKLSAELFEKVAARVEKFLVWIEKLSMPRWCSVVTGPGERFLGLYIAIVAGFLTTPIPFGNMLPAFGIALMAVGLIEKDGKAAVIGMALGFLGTLYICRRSCSGSRSIQGRVENILTPIWQHEGDSVATAAGTRMPSLLESADISGFTPVRNSVRDRKEYEAVAVLVRSELTAVEAWPQAFSHLRKDSRYYEIVEDTICPEFKYRYLAIKTKAGDICAIQPFFVLDQDLLAGPGEGRRLLRRRSAGSGRVS